MKEPEKLIITQNFMELIMNTDFTPTFIAGLRSCLGVEESDKLTLPSITQYEKAYHFYTLIQKRDGGYQALKENLERTSQTGALKILIQAEVKKYFGQYNLLKQVTKTTAYKTGNAIKILHGNFGTRNILIKVFTKNSKKNMEPAFNEIEMLNRVDWHENIVRYFTAKNGYIGFDNKYQANFAIALDYEMHLLEYLDNNKANIQDDERKSFVQQIWNGAVFLQKEKILHLNLKLESVFVSQTDDIHRKIKIGEFGFALQLADKTEKIKMQFKEFYNKYEYAAVYNDPDLIVHRKGVHSRYQLAKIENNIELSLSNDVFFLGVVLFQTVSSETRHPFGDYDSWRCNILNYNTSYIEHDDNKECFHMIDKPTFMELVSKNPKDRPDITEMNYLNIIAKKCKKYNDFECLIKNKKYHMKN